VREEPTEIVDGKRKGGIWKTGGKETQMRTYKGGAIIHTNPECPCYMLDFGQVEEWQLKDGVPKDIEEKIRKFL
jgi:hypothetical protein